MSEIDEFARMLHDWQKPNGRTTALQIAVHMQEMFGGDSPVAKPATSTTTQTLETATTDTSSLVQPLGEVLEELDSLMNTLTKCRNLLQFAYTNVPVGDNGPIVPENSDFDRVQFMVDWADKYGYLSEHCFTFPDGETWWATGHG